jgi:hypothetical protein
MRSPVLQNPFTTKTELTQEYKSSIKNRLTYDGNLHKSIKSLNSPDLSTHKDNPSQKQSLQPEQKENICSSSSVIEISSFEQLANVVKQKYQRKHQQIKQELVMYQITSELIIKLIDLKQTQQKDLNLAHYFNDQSDYYLQYMSAEQIQEIYSVIQRQQEQLGNIHALNTKNCTHGQVSFLSSLFSRI